MRITAFEHLHCDAGWRTLSFLKVSTDEGLVGWSEYNESYGNGGLTAVIEALTPALLGTDPRPVGRISAELHAMTRLVSGGVSSQAVAAIQNALLDVKAKALGVPLYEMLGGPIRQRLRVYWSHCGLYRLTEAALMGVPPVLSVDDLLPLGREVADRHFTALKTNIFSFDGGGSLWIPAFAGSPGWPELNVERAIIGAAIDQLSALREGAGPDVDIMLDLSSNAKTEGFVRLARALRDFDLFWLEADSQSPAALAYLRSSATMPVASCESLYGVRQYRPFLEREAVDVLIVDVPWNGLLESLKIAALADAYEVNVAPHNFYGHLATLMSAHFCALIPNFRIMETDIDDVPWKDDLVTAVPVLDEGHLVLPVTPGWGADVNEEAVRAHPPKLRASTYRRR